MGLLSKTLIFRENVDLLPAASGDGFVLDPGVEEQAGDVPLGERPQSSGHWGISRSLRLVTDKVLRARSPSVEPSMIGVVRRIRFYDTVSTSQTWILGWDYPVLVCVWVCESVRVFN